MNFDEQLNYFRQKINIPSEDYTDIYGKLHDYAFTVAGANTAELVSSFRQAVDAAIEGGETLEQFRARFDDIVAKTGWEYNGGRNWRTRIIFDTNVYSSYNRGRLTQQLALKDALPFWQYQHNDAIHPRKEHLAWHGMVLRADDEWWTRHYPVRAYGCHCTVRALDALDIQEMGLSVSQAPKEKYIRRIIGTRSSNPRLVELPIGVDPGFEENKIGTFPIEDIDQILLQKFASKKLDPVFVAKQVKQLFNRAVILDSMNQSMKAWTNRAANYIETKNASEIKNMKQFKYIGVLPDDVIEKLNSEGIAIATPIVGMEKNNLIHALRESKQAKGLALPASFWETLPEKIHRPDAILLEKGQKTPTLLFVYETDKGKIAVKINYKTRIESEKGKKSRAVMNVIVTGSLMDERRFNSLSNVTLIKEN